MSIRTTPPHALASAIGDSISHGDIVAHQHGCRRRPGASPIVAVIGVDAFASVYRPSSNYNVQQGAETAAAAAAAGAAAGAEAAGTVLRPHMCSQILTL